MTSNDNSEFNNILYDTFVTEHAIESVSDSEINIRALLDKVISDIRNPSMMVLTPEEIAQVLSFIIHTPSINELVIRPTAEL